MEKQPGLSQHREPPSFLATVLKDHESDLKRTSHLSDDEIWQASLGRIDADATEHLSSCPYCQLLVAGMIGG